VGKTFHHKKGWDDYDYDDKSIKRKKKKAYSKRQNNLKTQTLDDLADKLTYWDIIQDSD